MAGGDDHRLAAAQLDLKAAQVSIAAGDYGECCVQAERAAEKALKVLLHCHGIESQSDVLAQLLLEVRRFHPVPESLSNMAQELDLHYDSAFRLAYSGQCGLPPENFEPDTAARCLDHARQLLAFVETRLP